MSDLVERIITPMPHEGVAKIKAAVEQRWAEKPHYPGGGGILSPGCMFRAEEILSMIATITTLRAQLAAERDRALEAAAKVADKYHWKIGDDPELIAAAIRALKETKP